VTCLSFQLKGDLTKSDNFKDGLALQTTYKVIIFFSFLYHYKRNSTKKIISDKIYEPFYINVKIIYNYTCFTGIYK